MDRGWYLRFSVVIAAVVVAWLALWPSLGEWTAPPEIVRETFPGRISPGLDIQGGLRLMYEVEVDEYIKDTRDRNSVRLVRQLGTLLGIIPEGDEDDATAEQLREVQERVTVTTVGRRRIRVTFQNADDAEKLTHEWLRERMGDMRISSGQGELEAVLEMRQDNLDELRSDAVRQAERTVSNRIDELGLKEATVIGQNEDLIVEIPGADEAMFDRIREIIRRTARLEFKIVDDADDFVATLSELPEGIERRVESAPNGTGANGPAPSVRTSYLYASGEDARQRLQTFIESLTTIPQDHMLAIGQTMSEEATPGTAREEAYRTYYLINATDVTGDLIQEASVAFDPQEANRPFVSIQFKAGQGADKFEQMTGANVQRRMAIVLDDVVSSAPVIQTRIGGGRAQITLGALQDYNSLLAEAKDLVVVLRAGALPAPLRPANEQMIGPTLGRDSVRQGAMGALVGVCLVLLFMAIYYEVAGLVADLMVVLNLLFLLAIMAAFEATLTLPGVAAIALTVGMAVDANVLITERIREELRLGKSPRSAVDQGFARAFSSVFDSQLTTFIAGVVLFQFGTGPIKGFAVMLMIGIVTSLFTGIFCSKVFLDGIVRGLRVERLRVG